MAVKFGGVRKSRRGGATPPTPTPVPGSSVALGQAYGQSVAKAPGRGVAENVANWFASTMRGMMESGLRLPSIRFAGGGAHAAARPTGQPYNFAGRARARGTVEQAGRRMQGYTHAGRGGR